MSDKQTKKDLMKKIEELEDELKTWKCKTQLARNYSIVCAENDELKKKLKQRKEVLLKDITSEEVSEDEDEE